MIEQKDKPVENEIWVVNTDVLNFRTEASTNSSIIRQLTYGERVIVKAISEDDVEWRFVTTMADNRDGYIHAGYIKPYSNDNNKTIESRIKELESYAKELDAAISSLSDFVLDIDQQHMSYQNALEVRVRVLENKKGIDNRNGNNGGGGSPTNFDRDLSEGFEALNLKIIGNNDAIYKLSIGFTTKNGSFEWKKQGDKFHIEESFAKKILLDWHHPNVYRGSGADRNVHIGLINSNGDVIRPLDEDVYVKLTYPGHPNGNSGTWKILDKNNGFENFTLTNHYAPDRGQHGPYKIVLIKSDGTHISEEIDGLGLPWKNHISTWLLFQKIKETQT